jgi:hypothetical protein
MLALLLSISEQREWLAHAQQPRVLQEGYSKCFDQHSRELCNSVLTIIALFCDDPAFCGDLNRAGLLRLLVNIATTPELQVPKQIAVNPRLVLTDALGCEQRQLLWKIVSHAGHRSKQCLECALRHGFIKVILMYISPELSCQVLTTTQSIWCSQQLHIW